MLRLPPLSPVASKLNTTATENNLDLLSLPEEIILHIFSILACKQVFWEPKINAFDNFSLTSRHMYYMSRQFIRMLHISREDLRADSIACGHDIQDARCNARNRVKSKLLCDEKMMYCKTLKREFRSINMSQGCQFDQSNLFRFISDMQYLQWLEFDESKLFQSNVNVSDCLKGLKFISCLHIHNISNETLSNFHLFSVVHLKRILIKGIYSRVKKKLLLTYFQNSQHHLLSVSICLNVVAHYSDLHDHRVGLHVIEKNFKFIPYKNKIGINDIVLNLILRFKTVELLVNVEFLYNNADYDDLNYVIEGKFWTHDDLGHRNNDVDDSHIENGGNGGIDLNIFHPNTNVVHDNGLLFIANPS